MPSLVWALVGTGVVEIYISLGDLAPDKWSQLRRYRTMEQNPQKYHTL